MWINSRKAPPRRLLSACPPTDVNMKRSFAFCLGFLFVVPVLHATDISPLQWSVRMADSEMARRGDSLAWKDGGTAKWDYTTGLFTLSLLKLN